MIVMRIICLLFLSLIQIKIVAQVTMSEEFKMELSSFVSIDTVNSFYDYRQVRYELYNVVSSAINDSTCPYLSDEQIIDVLIAGLDSVNDVCIKSFCYNCLEDYVNPKDLFCKTAIIKNKINIFQCPSVAIYLDLTTEEKNMLFEKKDLTLFQRSILGDTISENDLIEKYYRCKDSNRVLYARDIGKIASEKCVKALLKGFEQAEYVEEYGVDRSLVYYSIVGLKYAFPDNELFSSVFYRMSRKYIVNKYADIHNSKNSLIGQHEYLNKVREWIFSKLGILVSPLPSDFAIELYYDVEFGDE